MSVHNVAAEIARSTVSGTLSSGASLNVTRHFASSTDISANSWIFINTTGTSLLITDIRIVSATVATGDCRVGFICQTASGALSGNDVCTVMQIGNSTSGGTTAASANVPVTATLTSTISDKTVAANGKLAYYVSSGAATGIAAGVIVVEMIPIV